MTDDAIAQYIIEHPDKSQKSLNMEIKASHDRVNAIYQAIKKSATKDIEIILENVRLARAVQKQQDLNRVRGKSFREQARLDNTLEEMNAQILEKLSKYDFSRFTKKHDAKGEESCGIVHLSDLHLNELVKME